MASESLSEPVIVHATPQSDNTDTPSTQHVASPPVQVTGPSDQRTPPGIATPSQQQPVVDSGDTTALHRSTRPTSVPRRLITEM